MKKTVSILVLSILMLTLLMPCIPIFAESTVVTSEGVEGSISSKLDVRWYRVILEQDGMSVITVQDIQDKWNGYRINWKATLYKSDKKTVIKEADIFGNKETTIIATGKVEAGTYYIKISAPSSNNPFMASFTSGKYKISAKTVYNTQNDEAEKGKTKTVSQSGQVICEIDGEVFIKMNDGEALVGLYRNKKGVVLPYLISEDKNAVSYMIASTGKIVKAWDTPYKIGKRDEEVKYFVSYGDNVEAYYDGRQKTSNLPLFFTDTQSKTSGDVTEAIIKQREIELAGGEVPYFFKTYWKTMLIVLAVAVGIVTYVCICNGVGGCGGDRDNCSGGGSGGGSTIDNPTWRDIDDMQIANKISNNINTPGYDSESFGPPAD